MNDKTKDRVFLAAGLPVVGLTVALLWWAWGTARLWVAVPVLLALWTAVGMLDSWLFGKPWPWDPPPRDERQE